MTYLGHWHGFPMLNRLDCMVIYWMRSMMNNDIGYWVVMIYQATMLHGLSTLEEY